MHGVLRLLVSIEHISYVLDCKVLRICLKFVQIIRLGFFVSRYRVPLCMIFLMILSSTRDSVFRFSALTIDLSVFCKWLTRQKVGGVFDNFMFLHPTPLASSAPSLSQVCLPPQTGCFSSQFPSKVESVLSVLKIIKMINVLENELVPCCRS